MQTRRRQFLADKGRDSLLHLRRIGTLNASWKGSDQLGDGMRKLPGHVLIVQLAKIERIWQCLPCIGFMRGEPGANEPLQSMVMPGNCSGVVINDLEKYII